MTDKPDPKEMFAAVLSYLFNFDPAAKPPDDREPIEPIKEEKFSKISDLEHKGPELCDDGHMRFWATCKDRTVLMVRLNNQTEMHISVWLERTPKPPWAETDKPKERPLLCFDVMNINRMPDQTQALHMAGDLMTKSENDLRHMLATLVNDRALISGIAQGFLPPRGGDSDNTAKV